MGNYVALATDMTSLPIDYDMPLLLEACQARGLRAEICSWEDPEIDWGGFDAVLLRSPWSYVEQLPRFLSWCERVTAVTHLLNPLPVVRWNLDKSYLGDLDAAGVPVVPSSFVAPEADPADALRAFLERHPEAGEYVVKPTVGAYSRDVQRYSRGQEADATRHIAKLLQQGCDALIQPYLDAIDRDGETDLVYFDGVYSHAIRKRALLLPDGTVDAPTQDARTARDAAEDERAVASAALAAVVDRLELDRPLLYGRVDLIRDGDGSPVLLELEVCEPSLSMPFAKGSAARFAEAIAVRLEDLAETERDRSDR
ncbi:ATP-grasp domain-containing protein [Streptomyces sp. NPDC003362]